MILSFHVFAAVSSSCRGFLWCFHPLKLSLHTVHCIKCLWGLHLGLLLPLCGESPPEIHARCSGKPTHAKCSCCMAWTFLMVKIVDFPSSTWTGFKAENEGKGYTSCWPWGGSSKFKWILAFSVVIFKLLSVSSWVCTLISVMALLCWI